MQSRRKFIIGAAAALTAGLYHRPILATEKGRSIMVYKTATCGCCQAWVEHLEAAGFSVTTRNVHTGGLQRLKNRFGIRPEYASCHTARIDGYVIEGHVPAGDILQLLAERPDALGLTVPGMPMGSPGMDFGPEKERYASLLLGRNGQARTYRQHN